MQTAHWYFGANAGVDFSSGSPVAVTDGALNTKEGTSSISDEFGNLLFYTDGVTVYTKSHMIMSNGENLTGSGSSTQSTLIVPGPGISDLFYIFTTDAIEISPKHGLRYSIVDMTLGTEGEVVSGQKNIPISLGGENNVSEKLAATVKGDCSGYWIITYYKKKFYVFSLTDEGIDIENPIISESSPFTDNDDTVGGIRVSPDGKKLAACFTDYKGSLLLYDFNNIDGTVSNGETLFEGETLNDRLYYSAEFSPNSKVLYATYSGLVRYDLTAASIPDSEVVFYNTPNGTSGALQTGLDGKIYYARLNNQFYLAAINDPNHFDAPNLDLFSVFLGGKLHALGLAGFPQPFYNANLFINGKEDVQTFCTGEPIDFSYCFNGGVLPSWTVHWDFGDENTSVEENPTHSYNEPGSYTITLDITIGLNVITVTNTVIVIPIPIANKAANLVVCDVLPNDGFSEFFLAGQTPSILGTQPAADYTVVYYPDENAAIAGSAPLPLNYNNIVNPQTVYARITNVATGCYDITSFTLTVNPVPKFAVPDGLEACENKEGTGITNFDLTQVIPQINLGNMNLSVKFYKSQEDLLNNIVIVTPTSYTNTVAGGETLYFQVTDPVLPECTSTGELQLKVNPLPVLKNNIAPYSLCDMNNTGDGFEVFDLISRYSSITNDTGLVLTYAYDNNGTLTTITDPGAFRNTLAGQQTIFVSTQNTFNCSNSTSFTILVNPLPVLSDNPADFIATECEELPGEADFDLDEIATAVTAGSASYVVYFYQTEAQALAGGADFEPGPTYLSGDADIWARVINPTTNCVRVARVELNVIPAPIATTPAPIAECDDNNDGFARFNLTPAMQAIEAAIPDVTVSAFETQSDADLNVNVIPSPEAYDNIVAGTQTLYLRVQSDLTDCYDTVTLVLIVNPRPDAHSPAQPYALCDDGTSDTDGIAHFNLNSQSAEILAGLDPAQYTVDYYTDAAATPASLIGTPGNYPSATATVYAKVTNTATGCFYIVAVRLVVNALPVLITNEYSYSLCDTTLPANKETFDLTTTIDKFITDENLNGVAVTFHTTLADAQGGTNALTDAQAQAYENTSQVQSLYVRFTVTTTGCFRLGYLDIRVEPQPVLTLPSQDELTVCDTDGNGIGEFNLEALKETLANGDTSLVITFHLTAEEALSGANPIGNTTDYRNDHPGTQTLWVRAVSSTTGCFNTTPFPVTLIVTPAPQAPKLQDITLCDDTDNNGQDGALRTDLTVYETQIKEAVAPVEVTITYYLSKADADAGSNGIASPARHIARDGQVIWVRVENTAGCYSLTSFTIHINKPHQLVTPTPLAVCNEALPNDGIAEFDLTQKDDEILGPDGVGMDYVVDYFTTDPKTDSTAVAIADPKAYVNTDSNGAAQNPRTIWVRVTTTQGCVSYTTLTIRVLPLPVPNFNPAPLEVCDQDTTEVGSEPFDLTLAQDDIRNNGTNYLFSYYTTEEDAQAGTNAIPDPTSHNSASGSVWVRVEANTNNPSDLRCFQIVELELIVNPLPPIADLADYGICNDTPASPTAFNLKEYVETALGGNTGTIYTIGYFSDAALTTRATPITGYVVTGSATVYIEVVNNDTGCRIVKELELIVEQQAVANPVADPAAVCDTDDQNDGRASGWDLTLLAPEVLGAQDPAVFLVSYYDIDPSTVPAPQPIQDPENYTNQTPESQVIWIVVTNSDTVQDTPCSATTTVTLRVERRAEPVITTADGSDTVCIEWGASEGELELNSGVVPNGHTYLWYKDGVLLTDSDDSGSYIAKTGGVYTVVVTGPAPLECVSDESAGFTVIESGQASAIGQGYYVTNYFSDNQTITVTIEGNGEYTYQLDNGPRQESPVFTNVSPGYHSVTVWDEKTDFPCQELVLNGVSIVDYPNFFTPNGDGFHDTWNIIGLSGTGSVIYIFDRYGKLIKQISPDLESSGWDGTLNGTPVPATDYWFTVTYPEFDGTTTATKEFKSHFSLKR
ncbi:hypothetical protein AMR72_02395 [Flavobacterium psychrophilum]|nr:hypothetical protein AMR72_02395 [Flavobacterium psychrophilum]AOE51470.1 hypothetical protein ALW18_02395 [Flavobacterium psychrophilum]